MGHKIFISYKYADSNVKSIQHNYFEQSTVRDYVDELETYIKKYSDHIFKAESDGEDLSDLSDDTIWEKLKDRIFDSTLTIVLISPSMKENKKERDQWIPWEVFYSLKAENRKDINGNDVKSNTNALLGIVIPDKQGEYDYFLSNKSCCNRGCISYKTSTLFTILRENMFNILNPNKEDCPDGSTVYHGDSSFLYVVKWDNFVNQPETYIDKAYDILSKKDKYDIHTEVE